MLYYIWGDYVKCIICGKEFNPKSSLNVICSEECRKKRKSQTAKRNYINIKSGIYQDKNKNFAEFNELKLGKDFLCRYWDYEKNNINPYKIQPYSHKYIYIKCQDVGYHESYKVLASNFTKGSRCPYCNTFASGKVHIKDSLGYNFKEVINIWSSKNEKTPYDYACYSYKDVWFKCEKGKHKDYKQKIYNKTKLGCGCPKCNESKGEKVIEEYLNLNNYEFEKEYKFNELVGERNHHLRFDFAILKDNRVKALVEYDGEFHYNKHFKSRDELSLIKQINRDAIKADFAKKNKIKLIRIPYWEFENINRILNKELKGVV